jgi:hypothetical protein
VLAGGLVYEFLFFIEPVSVNGNLYLENCLFMLGVHDKDKGRETKLLSNWIIEICIKYRRLKIIKQACLQRLHVREIYVLYANALSSAGARW